jgi:hypothetical protein
MSKRTTRLRRLLADPKILVAPGAYDGTGARLISALGFQALYMSGFETSASILGQPDVGYLTATQMADRVAALTDIVDLPLIADGDTGGDGLCPCHFFTWNRFRRGPRYEELSQGPSRRRHKQGVRRCGDVRRLQSIDWA